MPRTISGFMPEERVEMIADEGSFEEWDADLIAGIRSVLSGLRGEDPVTSGKDQI
ncbi:MAG: hypothetical protein ACLUUO_00325 [Sellimonas intestinalis]